MHYLYHDSWKRQDQQRKKKNSSVVANSLLSQYLLIVLFTVLKYHWLFKPRKTRRLLTDRWCSDLLRFADLEARQSGNSGGMRESRSLHFFNWPPHTVSCSRGSLPICLVLLSHPLETRYYISFWFHGCTTSCGRCMRVCVYVWRYTKSVARSHSRLEQSLLHIPLTF